MPKITGAGYRLAIQLVLALAAGAVSAQSLRVAEDPDELDRRARADSNDAIAQYNAALGWWSRQRWDRADSALARATALDPSFAPAWLGRAVVQERNERFWRNLRREGDSALVREARQRDHYLRRAFLADPFVDVRVLGSVSYRGYRTNMLERGLTALVEGRYPDAYRELEAGVRFFGSRGLDSVPPVVLWLHQLAAARSGHWDEAIADIEALLRLSLAREASDTVQVVPLKTNEFRYVRAALHQRAGRRDEALRLYREVLEHDVGNYAAHVQMAGIYEAANDGANAIASRRRAVQTNPDDHTLLIDLATTLARTGNWVEAESVLRQATEQGPRDPRGFYRLGVVTQQLGKPADARRSFERFLELAPSRLAPAMQDARQRLTQLGTP